MGLGGVRARGKSERIAVPAMPRPLAVLCCILNFLVPGFGTIIAGFSVCCCARNEDMTCCERLGSFLASFFIGLLQIILTPLLLAGWIWSCIWGVSFIGMSNEYYHDNPVMEDGVVVSQTSTVVTQPRLNDYPHSPPAGYQQQQQQQQQGTYQQHYPGYQQPQTSGFQPQPYSQPPQQPSGPEPSAPPAEGYDPAMPGHAGAPQPYYGEPPPPYSPPEPLPVKPLPK